jgi:hypothetical protein
MGKWRLAHSFAAVDAIYAGKQKPKGRSNGPAIAPMTNQRKPFPTAQAARRPPEACNRREKVAS